MVIKNVMLPTDFSLHSLDTVIMVSQAIPEKHNIFLFHAFDMPDSLLDAMKRVGQNSHQNLITEDLRIRCRQIKAKHKGINNIFFRIMYGTTASVFKNFAEANKINLLVLPPDYRFVPVVRESVNPMRMFVKSGIEIVDASELIGYAMPQVTKN